MSNDSTPILNPEWKAVLNHEEQYSIWPFARENPLGWIDAGFQGTKEECLEFIEKVWVDMRPLTLRKKMQANESMLSHSDIQS